MEIVKTYSGVWNTPLKIYSFQNFKLPIPLVPRDLLYFLIGILAVIILSFIPLVGNMPFVVKYIGIPFTIMKVLTKVKLDGKKPHKFLWGLLLFLFANKCYENFKPVRYIPKMSFKTPIVLKRSVTKC